MWRELSASALCLFSLQRPSAGAFCYDVLLTLHFFFHYLSAVLPLSVSLCAGLISPQCALSYWLQLKWTGTEESRKEELALILTVLHPTSPTYSHESESVRARARESNRKNTKRGREVEIVISNAYAFLLPRLTYKHVTTFLWYNCLVSKDSKAQLWATSPYPHFSRVETGGRGETGRERMRRPRTTRQRRFPSVARHALLFPLIAVYSCSS